MKIGVIMCYDKPLDINCYASICYAANKLYCDYYGYDLIFFDLEKNSNNGIGGACPVTKKPRFIAWNKILCVYEIMQENKYDYLVYIDCDAFFTKNQSLDKTFNFLNDITFVSNRPYVFDYVNKSAFSSNKYSFSACAENGWKTVPCSGVFLLKNKKDNLSFLKDWYYQTPNTSDDVLSRPWDQAGLWDLFLQQKYDITVLETEGFFTNSKVLTSHKKRNNLLHCSNKFVLTYEFIQNFYPNLNETKALEIIKELLPRYLSGTSI